jgi:hypothetical protein
MKIETYCSIGFKNDRKRKNMDVEKKDYGIPERMFRKKAIANLD